MKTFKCYFCIFFALSALILFSACKKHNAENKIVTNTDEYINYTVNGNSYSYVMSADSVFTDSVLNAETTEFGIYNGAVRLSGNRIPVAANDFAQIKFNIKGATQGSIIPLTFFYLPQFGTVNPTFNIYPFYVTSTAPVMITITELGAVNEYISGNFSGQLIGPASGNIPYNVSCNFRVRRRL